MQFPVTYKDINDALAESAQEKLLVHQPAKQRAAILTTKNFLLYAAMPCTGSIRNGMEESCGVTLPPTRLCP